jgi:hypothetical protein
MRARGDVIPGWAWLAVCAGAVGLMLADIVFFLFFGGGSSSLGRACLMAAMAFLLWKFYRQGKRVKRDRLRLDSGVRVEAGDSQIHLEVGQHHRPARDQHDR